MSWDRGIPGGVVAVVVVLVLLTWCSGDDPLACSARARLEIESTPNEESAPMSEPTMPAREPCRGCGAMMAKIRNQATGAFIPAQQVRSVYILVENLAGETELQKLEGLPKGTLLVSHFETCPNANDFTRGRG